MEKLSMRKTREVLRLKFELDLSDRQQQNAPKLNFFINLRLVKNLKIRSVTRGIRFSIKH